MPVALLLRLLVRVGASLLFWRFATARRNAATAGARRAPSPAAPAATRRVRLLRARETASLAVRVLTLVVLLAIAAVCVAAGLGPTILGPRWLGIALLVVACAAAVGAGLEALRVQRGLAARNRRRHDSDLARQVYP